ncbi:alpha/beta hydrolase family protein [Chryseobacterium caseinilyticum]|uniref:Prolyl oligopeptidase family serine peptidase n=1 Tax=Chryseobacterium caseinilyticum TaxID=2771428 RepID=A0ABR8ZGQ3_9FLAO|nr:prolyl oligopeptidase family serine peptidase [Chryseobacterium caseinilyticum]MBD8084482.1 prolyl oligopeptidase family serine peptidase [Chryseobacterium caseinilyticum]
MVRLFLLLVFCAGICIPAQETGGTLKGNTREYANIRILASSSDQRYVVLHKTYRTNSDTVLIFERKSANPIADTILGQSDVSFLTDETILSSGYNKAGLLNLRSRKVKTFDGVKRTVVLKDKKQFVIEDGKGNITVYSKNGNLLKTLTDVTELVGNGKVLYAMRKGADSTYEIIKWDGQRIKLVYKTEDKINKITFLDSGKFLTVNKNKVFGNRNIFTVDVVRISDDKVFQSDAVISSKGDRINVTQIYNEEVFLVDFQKTERPVESNMLEIWYAGDKTFRDQKTGSLSHDYYVWNVRDDKVKQLSVQQFNNYVGMLDSRFLWAYSSDENFSYTGEREFDIYLYDAESGKSEKIFERVGRLIASTDRRFTLGYEINRKEWLIYDHISKKSEILHLPSKASNPIFTGTGEILFETETDLLKYHVKSKSSELLNIGKGEKVKFYNFNPEVVHGFSTFTASVSQIKTGESLFLNVSRYLRDDTAYYAYDQNRLTEIIPFTRDNVREFTYSPNAEVFFSVEENFNRPAVLNQREVGSAENKILYSSTPAENRLASLKQEILHYKNSLGQPLKGVLYYPVDYNPEKKYPMIVHIYGILNTGANKFLSSELGNNGFSKKLLLENGYFVFQPDIVPDGRGMGRAALDCVNAGLDSVLNNINIDAAKVGLIGHSLGGYETNFIATQSDRFAAYVSGASLGDITSFYFSFNELFKVADYSRFESGQFAMNASYAENKELYFRNNPVNYVENVNAPMLMWCGKKDTNAPTGQTMNFFMGLLRNGKKAVALLYDSQKHSIAINSKEIVDLNRRALDWWNYFLKDEKEIEWINKEIKDAL